MSTRKGEGSRQLEPPGPLRLPPVAPPLLCDERRLAARRKAGT